MSKRNQIVLSEQGNKLIIRERRGGMLVTIMEITAGAVTEIQREYYRANVKGRIRQAEADLILKYFYNIDID